MSQENLLYFHLKVADLAQAQAACKDQHEKTAVGTQLSITYNIANTECLVKVDGGADPAWKQAQAWILNALHIYDNTNKSKRFADLNFYGPDWQLPDKSI